MEKMDEYQKFFHKLQSEADLLILLGNESLPAWNNNKMETCMKENKSIPTGSFLKSMTGYSIFVNSTSPIGQQGRFSGKAVLQIKQPEPINNQP